MELNMAKSIISLHLVIIALLKGISADYPDPTLPKTDKQKEALLMQPCYSCNSATALCDEEVFDGTYLTKVPCNTKCYVKREGNVIYRGCFDGFLGGQIKYNYEGCQVQKYLGQKVEWCFCSNPGGNLNGQPCNAISARAMGSTIVDSPTQYKYTYVNNANQIENANQYYGNSEKQQSHNGKVKSTVHFEGIPVPDYKQYMLVNGQASVQSYNIEAKEAPSHPKLTIPKYKMPELPEEKGFPPLTPIEFYKEKQPHHRPQSVRDLIPIHLKNHPCSSGLSGLVADKMDCSRYYLCSNGIPYHMKCPYATIWNEELMGCVFTFNPTNPCETRSEEEKAFFKEDLDEYGKRGGVQRNRYNSNAAKPKKQNHYRTRADDKYRRYQHQSEHEVYKGSETVKTNVRRHQNNKYNSDKFYKSGRVPSSGHRNSRKNDKIGTTTASSANDHAAG